MVAGVKERLTLQQSRWYTEADFQVHRFFDLEPFSPGTAISKLELINPNIPTAVLDSVLNSSWYAIDQGRIIIEVRNPKFNHKIGNAAYIIDYDDCIMSTTLWHQHEFAGIALSRSLHDRDIHIGAEQASDIYELSKIKVPGKVDHEPRYTPLLNLTLLSHLAKFLESRQTPEEAWQNMLGVKERYVQEILQHGEGALVKAFIDDDILAIFLANTPANFVYHDLLDHLLHDTYRKELRIIATRGKIEGLLGQVYKLHMSGVMNSKVDLVVYSNDIKAEALILLSRLIPWIKDVLIRVFDDNPAEVLPYTDLARSKGIQNLEIIQVRHPLAKPRKTVIREEPALSFTDAKTNTIYNHFFPIDSIAFIT